MRSNIFMKFKVGDYVRVKKDLKSYRTYNNVLFVEPMECYRDKIYKVININISGNYHLDGCVSKLDGQYWAFSEEMLESATKYQVGDYVRVKNDLKTNEWYNSVLFNKAMECYRGRIYRVVDITWVNYNLDGCVITWANYNLDGCVCEFDDHYWAFGDEMLEPAPKLWNEKQSLKARGNMDAAYNALRLLSSSVYGAYNITDMIHNYSKADVDCTIKMIKETNPKQPEIDKVMPNEKKRAVAVKFKDGDVVTVKCSKDDKFDIYTGVAHAIAKKMFKSGSHFKKVVDSLTVADKSKKKVNAKKEKADDKAVKETKKTSNTKKEVQ